MQGGGDWTEKNERPDGSYTLSTYVDGLFDKTEVFKSDDSLVSSTSIRDSSGTVGSGYDSINRVIRSSDSRTGVSETVFLSTTSDYPLAVSDPGSRTTRFTYDSMGRRTSVNAEDTPNPAGGNHDNITNTIYNLDGTVQEVNGDQTYRRTYTYDYADRMATMTTYGTQNATTTWIYSQDRGFLTRKEYDDGKGTDYTYTDAGRLQTRVWERGITTTYIYDDSGRLTDTNYSDSTPDVNIVYDALSRPKNQTNGVALISYAYDPAILILDKETITYDFNTDGTPELVRVLDRSQDDKLRPDGLSLTTVLSGIPPTSIVDFETSYAYDLAGRLSQVEQTGATPTATFDYGFESSSYGLIETVTGPHHLVTNVWDTTRNVLDTTRSFHLIDFPLVREIADTEEWAHCSKIRGQERVTPWRNLTERRATRRMARDALSAQLPERV